MRDLRFGGDDPTIADDVVEAYRIHGEQETAVGRAYRRGERLGRLVGRAVAATMYVAVVAALVVGAVAVAHQVWRVAVWAWSWT